MKNFRIEAIILAIGLLLLGVFIEKGFSKFAEKDRSITVKGLAEIEVPANKVTWPLVYKSLGNDLGRLYDDIKRSNQTITGFLKEKGLTEQEISVNARKSSTWLPNVMATTRTRQPLQCDHCHHRNFRQGRSDTWTHQ